MVETRGDRLKMARSRLFKSARAAAAALNVPVSTYGAHERAESPGGRDYGPDEAKRYARRFGVTTEWLLTGHGSEDPISFKTISETHGPLKLQPKKQRTVENYDDDMTHAAVGNIPEIDLRAGASYAGGFAQEEVTIENGHVVSRDAVRAQWGIPLIFLRDELHVHPGRVHILPIRGDSMADALFDGDRAGVDLDDVDISQGGIFAILDDNGSVIVKQVELLRDNKGNIRKILCKSRNPHYQPFELTLEDPVRILGRVAFRITRL